jgi:quercetin dioxygenase-like cupin family protein
MRITLNDEPAVAGARQFPGGFDGEAWITHLARPGADTELSVQRVVFAPGALTTWHSHPRGQIMHIISGLGSVQVKGEDARILRPGDTVVAPPGEQHRHGAAPGSPVVMIAVQGGRSGGGVDGVVEWGTSGDD